MKTRHMVMAAAFLGAAALVAFSDPVATAPVSEAVERPEPVGMKPVSPSAGVATEAGETGGILKLRERSRLMQRQLPVKSTDLFRAQSWAPVEGSAVSAASKATPPVLPFTYVGQQSESSGLIVFLATDENTYAVRVGDVLEEKYRVERIESSVMTLIYLPLQAAQTLPLE